MAVTGNIITKFKTRRALTTTKVALDKAYKAIAPKIEREIKATISKQTGKRGPPSPPGTPPYKRSGSLKRSVRVTGSEKKGIIVRTVFYGDIHENRQDRFRRPFVRPVLQGQRKKWQDQLAKLSRKFMGGKPKKGRRR